MNKKYAIVNDMDCPKPRLVTQIIDGKCYYMMRAVEDSLKQYDGMQPDRPTFLEDFGFKIIERQYQVDFIKVRESKATYKDGKIRHWQGELDFSLPKVILKD